MRYKTVLVTGGCGFIGSHLVDALVDISERVIVIDKVKPLKDRKNSAVKYYKKNVQEAGIEEIFKKEKPERLFHFAAHIQDRESVERPIMNVENNIIGSINVFQAFKNHCKGKILFASTAAVYGVQSQIPIIEQSTLQPGTPYGISKLTGEQYLSFYYNIFNIPFTALRMANVYGPRQDTSAESGAIAIFTGRLLKGESVYINNDGSTTRDYLFVKDAVNAFLKASESDYVGVLNVGTGIETTTKEVFELIEDSIGIEAKPEYRDDVKDVVRRSALDSSKAYEEIKWSAIVNVKEGIGMTVDWAKEQ